MSNRKNLLYTLKFKIVVIKLQKINCPKTFYTPILVYYKLIKKDKTHFKLIILKILNPTSLNIK